MGGHGVAAPVTKELTCARDRYLITMCDREFETLFKALADHTRLRLIHLLGDDELCVCACVAILNTSQPKISRHLAYLKRAGLVAARREGKWTHYRLVEPSDTHAAKIFNELRESLATHPQMQTDKARLDETTRAANATLQSPDARQTAAANR
jgi:ArsR family transcriptional regulator, arsenate/arsenite/antimonite-responsive transcriptional repressor